jgi:hypothetical protein
MRELSEVKFEGAPDYETILRFGLDEIRMMAPGGHADPDNPCYGEKRRIKEYAQRIVDAAEAAWDRR